MVLKLPRYALIVKATRNKNADIIEFEGLKLENLYNSLYIETDKNNFFYKLIKENIYDENLFGDVKKIFSVDALFNEFLSSDNFNGGLGRVTLWHLREIFNKYVIQTYLKQNKKIPKRINDVYKLFKDRITTWYSTTNIDKNEKDIKKIMKPYGIKKNNKYIEIEKELDNIYQSVENNISHNNFFYNLKTKNKINKKLWYKLCKIFLKSENIYKMYHKSNFSSGYENRLKVYRLYEFYNQYLIDNFYIKDKEIEADYDIILEVFYISFVCWD
jgi:hypothetical protein